MPRGNPYAKGRQKNEKNDVKFWQPRERRKKFIENFEKKLGIEKYEDWYGVKIVDLERSGGRGILNFYERSIAKMLRDLRPEHDWRDWFFFVKPFNYWALQHNRIKYIFWLSEKLKRQIPQDLENITRRDFLDNFGGGLVSYCERNAWNWRKKILEDLSSLSGG